MRTGSGIRLLRPALVAAAVGCALTAASASAQVGGTADGEDIRPEIVIIAPLPAGCATRGSDGERRLSLDCLNQRLQPDPAARQAVRPDLAAAAGRAPPSRTGTFSRSATAQRMGNAFGKSARPQRPPPPVFAPPVRGRP